MGAVRLHVLEQRLAASGERPDRLLGHAGELAHPLHRLRPVDTKRAGELVAEVGLVQVAGGQPVRLQDRFPRPAPATPRPRCGSCWRRSRACGGGGPAPARCGAGTRPPRTPTRAPGGARRVRAERRTPLARGSQAPPATLTHVANDRNGVISTGNWYATVSGDSGMSFTCRCPRREPGLRRILLRPGRVRGGPRRALARALAAAVLVQLVGERERAAAAPLPRHRTTSSPASTRAPPGTSSRRRTSSSARTSGSTSARSRTPRSTSTSRPTSATRPASRTRAIRPASAG